MLEAPLARQALPLERSFAALQSDRRQLERRRLAWEDIEMRGGWWWRRQLMRRLVATLCLAVSLAPAAMGADATQCPDDSALGGWIRYRTTYHEQPFAASQGATGCDMDYTQYLLLDMLQMGPHFTRASIDAMLPAALKGSAREKMIQQMLNQSGTHALVNTYYISRIRYQIWTDGCIKVPGGTDAIIGLGPARTAGTFVLGEDSPMGFRKDPNVVRSVGYFEFNAMNPKIVTDGTLVQVDAIGGALAKDWQASLGQSVVTFQASRPRLPLPQVEPPLLGGGSAGDPYGVQTDACPGAACFQVEPTKCDNPDAAQLRDCVTNPSKYAVIPFEGKNSWRSATPRDETSRFLSSTISWKICCGCGKGEPPDFPNKPCPDTAGIDGLLATNRAQEAAKAADLATLWASYEEEMSKAQSHLQQFQTTMRACNVQNKLTELLEGTLGLFSPAGEAAIAAEGAEEAEAIKQAVEMLGPQIGDPASTFFTVISKLMSNEDPTAKLIPNETYQTYLEVLEVAEKVISSMNGSSATQLEEQLNGCAGTIGLSYETWKGANEYIEDLKAAMANVPASQVLVNDIRGLDAKLPELQYQDYAACVRRARCLKQPESSCDKLKPAGNWPNVQ